jgi:hypothetical protein
MATSRKIVKIFLASPGDLSEERRVAKFAVDEFNRLWADSFGYHLELVGWEDVAPSFGRPQALINRDLEECELFVGMMWKRWGTPPSASGPYSSGFEEEYSIALQKREAGGTPEIALYFKNVDTKLLEVPDDDLKKVVSFRTRVIAEKKLLFDSFDGAADFRERFSLCIGRYLQRLRASDKRYDGEEQQALGDKQSSRIDIHEPQKAAAHSSFSVEGAEFLRGFIAKAESELAVNAITATEVARFRLLAATIRRPGNNEDALGTHDANILFTQRADLDLGEAELRSMIECACAHYKFQNVPLWYWLRKVGVGSAPLSMRSVSGSIKTRVGALSSMRLVGERANVDGPLSAFIDQEFFFSSWLGDAVSSEIKVAALEYLADWGSAEALPHVMKEVALKSYQTRAAACHAALAISLRVSRSAAIRMLIELQPEKVAETLLQEIFLKPHAINTDELQDCIGSACLDVRRLAAKILRERNELPLEKACQFLEDDDAEIRYEALLCLEDWGRIFSLNDARRILVKPKPGPYIFFSQPDLAGEGCFLRYTRRAYTKLSDEQLQALADKESVLDRDVGFVLMERQFSLARESLKISISDRFRSVVSQEIQNLEVTKGESSSFVERARSGAEATQKKLTRKALTVLCRRGDATDLPTVRSALSDGFIEHSDVDLDYLRKYGDWNDIPLVIDLIGRGGDRPTLLIGSYLDDAKARRIARIIYALGHKKFTDLASIKMPTELRAFLIFVASDETYREMDNDSVIRLLLSDFDQVRRAAVLKCVHSYSRERLEKLLQDYLALERARYYSVIHWLDFGISTANDVSVTAVARLIKQALED